MNNSNLKITSFYKFKNINSPKKVKSDLDKLLKNKNIRGTILLANEGINASISGDENSLKIAIEDIKYLTNIRDFNFKTNDVNFLPFNKMKVRIKKEIVSLGKEVVNVKKYTGELIHPKDWNKLLNKKNIKLIDTRNKYEFDIGHFKNAINPETSSFRDFPNQINKLGIKRSDQIVMYCTGGIRCEKVSAYLKAEGYQNVSQLEGGIINFLEFSKNSTANNSWNGECFVFDNRVTVNKKLKMGSYRQCHGCRHPITENEIKLKSYVKGVSCKYCNEKRRDDQKKRSKIRQDQIDKAERLKIDHPFKKIYSDFNN